MPAQWQRVRYVDGANVEQDGILLSAPSGANETADVLPLSALQSISIVTLTGLAVTGVKSNRAAGAPGYYVWEGP